MWKPYDHLCILSHYLWMAAEGHCPRLMVFMPPQHGKSTLIGEYFPAWYLGRNPYDRVIYTSYEADFAASWGRKARNVVDANYDLLNIKVSKESSAANRWDLGGYPGGMNTAGADGPITGKGGKIIVIDDPVKNAEQAESETYQGKIYEWYKSVVRTRLHDGGAIILVMTRWNENDLAGKLLKAQEEGGEQWVVLKLQALAEEMPDPLGRQAGDPLCPYLFSKDHLLATKGSVGSYWWDSMYQQNPIPRTGSLIKRDWWRYYTEPLRVEDMDQVLMSWDMAFKDVLAAKAGNPDYVVGQIWGRKDADFFMFPDRVRSQLGFPETLREFRGMCNRWPKVREKIVEDKANGPAVIATLRTEIPGIIPWNPEGSKVARVNAVSPYLESGNVYLPAPLLAPWIEEFVDECSAFPNGANDDQVDAMSQALLRLSAKLERPGVRVASLGRRR